MKDFLTFHVPLTALSLLAKFTGLVREHEHSGVTTSIQEGPTVLPDIKAGRGEYKVSFTYSLLTDTYEHWFNTRKGKRIFTVDDSEECTKGVHDFRLELVRFEVRFNPFTTITVERPNMTFLKDIVLPERKSMRVKPFDPSESLKPIGMNHYTVDFSEARYSIQVSHPISAIEKEESLKNALKIIERQLKGKDKEVNELLTGIKNDGEFVTLEGDVLAKNIVCAYCGLPAFVSKDSQEHTYTCIREHTINNLPGDNVYRVDPVDYAIILGNTKEELYDLLFNC